MTLPKLIKEDEPTPLGWRRTVRDAVNNLIRRLADVGAQRPSDPVTGTMFYDTSLGKPIWWNGTVWKDAAGTTV
jgi:hypothetical protein